MHIKGCGRKIHRLLLEVFVVVKLVFVSAYIITPDEIAYFVIARKVARFVFILHQIIAVISKAHICGDLLFEIIVSLVKQIIARYVVGVFYAVPCNDIEPFVIAVVVAAVIKRLGVGKRA